MGRPFRPWFEAETLLHSFVERLPSTSILTSLADALPTSCFGFSTDCFEYKLVKSDDTPDAPVPVYLRFENQTTTPVSVYWFSHTGEEKLYYSLNGGCSIAQQSYAGNVWVVKDKASDKLLLRIKADTRKRQLCCIRQVSLYCTADPSVDEPTEEDVAIPSCYSKRVTSCQGIAIVGGEKVCLDALMATKEVVERMLQDCPKVLVDELVAYRCKVAVIAKDQVTTDILEHSHLRGSSVFDGRDWDSQVRGLGGTKTIPTCSVGEENVLRCPYPEDKYYQESILIHEFAHTIMEVAFDDKLNKRILDIYNRSKGLYTQGIYMAVDAREYWAEGSESWFNASLRKDVNDGINTREKLRKHDPELAQLMAEVYGDSGTWRYDFSPFQPLPLPSLSSQAALLPASS
eukprot:TRINITY_DN19243_c0_g1_i1.p1 TRINITY_DN19243_c0_g1~~TRINITY_DN19243_c0_g1_i1.p1  ORF type:complete len:402 (+),score=57.74 TRINITY_DN19243_c0_g1_i1:693-1898(+)